MNYRGDAALARSRPSQGAASRHPANALSPGVELIEKTDEF
jgi:hypothetical protein